MTTRSFSEIELTTARLFLCPLKQTDAAALFQIHADPEFMRFWSTPPWQSIDQAHSKIASDQLALAAGEHIRLGIFLKQTEELLGTVSLFHFDWQSKRAELGYGIASPHWRKGYMHEAVSALITYAFQQLDLRRLEADVDPRNLASMRSLEKLGFVQEGLLRERWIVAGEVSDTALFGLLASDFIGCSLSPGRARISGSG